MVSSPTEPKSPLRIGILAEASKLKFTQQNFLAIFNPASSCTVSAIASSDDGKQLGLDTWGKRFDEHEEIVVYHGDNKYDDIIHSNDVDALYVCLPAGKQKEYVLQALKAGKHVLVEKPVSLSADDCTEMITVAQNAGKYLLDGTTFMNHPRLSQFLDYVSGETTFGKVERINSSFSCMGERLSVLCKKGDALGCIGDLGWKCIRIALVVLSRVGMSGVKSAHVEKVKTNDDGVPTEATCFVAFDGGCILEFDCSYLHTLRQRVEVCGEKRSACMTDFVLPMTGTNSFQVFEEVGTDVEEHTVQFTDMIECESGPQQEVLMWRNFARVAEGFDNNDGSKGELGWEGHGDFSKEALEVSALTIQTHKIIDALMESLRKGGRKVYLSH